MSGLIIVISVALAQIFLIIAMLICLARMIIGPRAQDRILAYDALYVAGMLLSVTFGIRSGTTLYFEIALIIGLLGFVSTAALAKFLMRGEVIE